MIERHKPRYILSKSVYRKHRDIVLLHQSLDTARGNPYIHLPARQQGTVTTIYTDADDGARLIRFTMLDTGVTRKGVSGLTVVLRESIRSGVVGDTDTLYFAVTDSSLIMHYLPHSSYSGYTVILKEPLVVGAQYLTNPDGIDKPNGTVPTEITHAGVQRTVKAGTFSTVECRITTRMDGAPCGGTFEREETEHVALAPGNFFVWVKEISRDTYPSGKYTERIGDFELVRIEKR